MKPSTEKQLVQYPELSGSYDDTWYKEQVEAAFQSALLVTETIWQYFQPQSVLDVGCGRGAWLKAWGERGSQKLYGLDGNWNSQEKLMDAKICFTPIDLNLSFSVPEKVDLCQSLEVAEHLNPKSSTIFVESMTRASDLILFGAAFIHQGGTHHINEQKHSYWAKIFLEKDFVPFDLLRPLYWSDDRICYWYRQNTFLYVKKNSNPFHVLISKGILPIHNIEFMDCVHPELFETMIAHFKKEPVPVGVKTHLADFIPSVIRAIKRRFQGMAS